MKNYRSHGLILLAVVVATSILLLQGVCLAGNPNLKPVKPEGWADKIVVMDSSTNYGYTGTVTQMQQVYINYAWKNFDTSAAGSHTARLYIDGQEVTYTHVGDGQLAAGNWMKLDTSFEYAFETSGDHTLRVEIETGGTVADESKYPRTITVQSDSEAHLRPYKPTGWSDKIVVSSATGATSDYTIYVNEISYVNFAWMNIGDVPAQAGSYAANVYVDGELISNENQYLTNPSASLAVQDWDFIFTSSGNHTLTLGVRANGEAQEYTYTRTINVCGDVVNLKPYTPTGWDSPIVVSNQSGTTTDYTPTAGQTAYIDISWQNTSETLAVSHTVVLYADGAEIYSLTTTLAGGYYDQDIDTEYIFASSGSQTLSLVVDVNTQVTESDETDNTYTRTVYVQAAAAPTISSISRTFGYNTAVVPIEITGTGFIEGANNTVRFIESTTGAGFELSSEATSTFDTIIVNMPEGAPGGTYNLMVINANGTSDLTTDITYEVRVDPDNPYPDVTGISPGMGPNTIDIPVTITGENFDGATGVMLAADAGTIALTNVVAVSSTEVTATVPSGTPFYTPATYDIRVTNVKDNTNPISTAKFILYAPVAMGSINTDDIIYKGVDLSGTNGLIPVSFTLSGAAFSTVTEENSVTASVGFAAGTTVTSNGVAYTEIINPPCQVASAKALEDYPNLKKGAVVFEMGNPLDPGMKLSLGKNAFLKPVITANIIPTIYYLDPDKNKAEKAGVADKLDWTVNKDTLESWGAAGTYDVTLVPGGKTYTQTAGATQTTYTVGVALDHMSKLAGGSVSVPAAAAVGDGDGGVCFIATAAYGSPFEASVEILRDFRDVYLMPHQIGQTFVEAYYRYSPPIADFISKHDTLKAAVRVGLAPVVGMSYVMLHAGLGWSMAMLLGLVLFVLLTVVYWRRREKGCSMFKYLTVLLLCLTLTLFLGQSVCLAEGGTAAAGVGAEAAGAGAGGAAGISAAAVAGISAAAAAAIIAGALSGDDSGIGVLGFSTSHETPEPEQPHEPGEETTSHHLAPYHPPVTPTHISPSHHSTATHH